MFRMFKNFGYFFLSEIKTDFVLKTNDKKSGRFDLSKVIFKGE